MFYNFTVSQDRIKRNFLIMIRNVKINDAREIAEIYNHYVENTLITFEETAVTENEMTDRIKKNPSNLPWIVYEDNNEILGYAYATEWKSRCAYKYSVEGTIYLRQGKQRKGLGTKLYQELLKQIKDNNIHAIIGGISLPNEASIALHEKLGFKKVAHFKEVGFKFEKWIDVGYWELLLSKD